MGDTINPNDRAEPRASSSSSSSTASPRNPRPPRHPSRRIHYANINTSVPSASGVQPSTPSGAMRNPSDPNTAFSPSGIRRRATNATTAFKAYEDYDNTDMNWPGWHPGSEPGFDPAKPDGGHDSVSALSAACEITVMDFSHERVETRNFDNDGFIDFIRKPEPSWAKCRWININGVSWDVIQAVGTCKNLHKLAIEDIMNTLNRTKCDWYQNHAFIVLTLQKLVHLIDPDLVSSDSESDSESESDSGSDASSTHTFKIPSKIKRFFRRRRRSSAASDAEKNIFPPLEAHTSASPQPLPRAVRSSGTQTPIRRPLTPTLPPLTPTGTGAVGMGMGMGPTLRHSNYLAASSATHPVPMRSLQRYRATSNEARSEFMEKHSSLSSRGLAVSAEQVAIFLNSDNTVISFFELSADDVQRPILKRLSTPGTILRQSCDASLIVQAIIDAIIDLAVPLTSVYSDVIGDLELDVLTSPSIKQSRSLYIIISEINKMLSFLSPIDNLVSVLRDHKTTLTQEQATTAVLQNNGSGVIVTPMTHTYLGDVLDQCMVVTEALHQIKQSADNLIGLIFNTISAAQNESMTQLTTATIVFLPLTFLTGYFGMNFEPFYELTRGTDFFWTLAVPTVVVTIIVLMRNFLYSWGTQIVQRHWVAVARRKKDKRKRRTQKKRRAERERESLSQGGIQGQSQLRTQV